MENNNLKDINTLTVTEEIWNKIEQFFLAGLNPNKIMEKTGIPAALIRDTIQDQLVKS